MKKKKTISALIGLVGAVGNNGKTADTDRIVMEALLSEESDEVTKRIHEEKYAISPDCRTCSAPCGNTSDYEISRFDESDENILELKDRVIDEIIFFIQEKGRLPEAAYRAISYLGYDLSEETYLDLIEDIKNNK